METRAAKRRRLLAAVSDQVDDPANPAAEFKFDTPGAKLAMTAEPELRRLLFQDQLDVGPDSEVADILAWLLHFDHQDIAAQLLREGRADPWPAWETCVRQVLRGDRWLLQHAKIDPNKPVSVPMPSTVVLPARVPQPAQAGDTREVAPMLILDTLISEEVRAIARRLDTGNPHFLRWVDSGGDTDELPPPELADELLRLRWTGHPLDRSRYHDRDSEEMQELAACFPQDYVKWPRGGFMQTRECHWKNTWVEITVQADRIRTLLEFGANPQPAFDEADLSLRPPLNTTRNHAILRLLLEAKADPDGYGEHSAAPVCAHLRHSDAVRVLLEAGADPNARESRGPDGVISLSVLHHCLADSESLETFLVFLEFGAELWEEVDGFMRTPLSTLVDAVYWSDEWDESLLSQLLRFPCAQPISCTFCMDPQWPDTDSGCWNRAVFSARTALVHGLVRTGYPARQGHLDTCRQLLEQTLVDAPADPVNRGDDEPFNMEEAQEFMNMDEDAQAQMRISNKGRGWIQSMQALLATVTPDNQARRRQEYLSEFWDQVMKATGLSGVVSSLAFQALIPDFRIRII